MNLIALILLATLSCGIVAVSLRLHAGLARSRGPRSADPRELGYAQRRDAAA